MRSLLVAVALGTAVISASPGGRPAPAHAPAQLPATIPFELVNHNIVIKVRINGSRPLSFVFDTGAEPTIVMSKVAKELGLTQVGVVSVGGAGEGKLEGSMILGAMMTIEGFKGFVGPIAGAIPLPTASSGLGQPIDGIVGTQFIQQYVIAVDYQAHTLTIHDPNTFDYKGTGESIPIEFYEANPTLSATVTPIGGQPLTKRFMLDLGNAGALVLHRPFVDEQKLLGAPLKTIRLIGSEGVGGFVRGRVGRVDGLQIGTFKFSQVMTEFAQDREGSFADPNLAGNIGAQIASRFRVILDYSRKRVILEPAPTFADPFGKAQSGLAIHAIGDDFRIFIVRDVLENSPASEAGLAIGDEITAINGTLAEQFSLTRIYDMFEKAVTYELAIRRGTTDLKVKLTPRKLI